MKYANAICFAVVTLPNKMEGRMNAEVCFIKFWAPVYFYTIFILNCIISYDILYLILSYNLWKIRPWVLVTLILELIRNLESYTQPIRPLRWVISPVTRSLLQSTAQTQKKHGQAFIEPTITAFERVTSLNIFIVFASDLSVLTSLTTTIAKF
jgi:hypothetical protein